MREPLFRAPPMYCEDCNARLSFSQEGRCSAPGLSADALHPAAYGYGGFHSWSIRTKTHRPALFLLERSS
jgi:hypothetical protein